MRLARWNACGCLLVDCWCAAVAGWCCSTTSARWCCWWLWLWSNLPACVPIMQSNACTGISGFCYFFNPISHTWKRAFLQACVGFSTLQHLFLTLHLRQGIQFRREYCLARVDFGLEGHGFYELCAARLYHTRMRPDRLSLKQMNVFLTVWLFMKIKTCWGKYAVHYDLLSLKHIYSSIAVKPIEFDYNGGVLDKS